MSAIDHAHSTSDDLYLEAREREAERYVELQREVIADLPTFTDWMVLLDQDDVANILLCDTDFSGEDGLDYCRALNRVKAVIDAYVQRQVELRS